MNLIKKRKRKKKGNNACIDYKAKFTQPLASEQFGHLLGKSDIIDIHVRLGREYYAIKLIA